MKQIEKSKHLLSYVNNNLINKNILIIRESKNSKQIYIFELLNIECKYPVIYKINKCKMLNIPNEKNIKSYVYDKINEIKIEPNDKLYLLETDEFLNIFKKFIENDNTYSNITNII